MEMNISTSQPSWDDRENRRHKRKVRANFAIQLFLHASTTEVICSSARPPRTDAAGGARPNALGSSKTEKPEDRPMAASSNVFVGVAGYVGRPEAAGSVGVFRRAAEGGEWSHVLPDLETFTIAVHPANPEIVLAGTADGVWRSTDRGATFARTKFPDTGKQIWSFLVDARNPKRVFAGSSPVGVYRSEDSGESWRRLPDPGIKDRATAPFAVRVMRMAQHPVRHDEIYAALEVNGVIRTTDGGETWSDCSADLIRLSELPHLKSKIVTDTFAEGMLDGHAIAVSQADPDAVILACRMGLFRSADQGRTWQDMDMKRFSPITYGRDVRVAPQDPKTMYAALSVAAASKDGGIYRSQDTGRTWKRFDKVQVHGTIMSVGLHHTDPDQVYIGARYEGEVFGTLDGGETWASMPLPGPVKDIYAVACG
jgi:photosystem II stability/assembly factor-like uncharacterized protein